MLTRRNWLKAGVAAAAAGTASVAQAATGKAAPSQKSNINKTLPSETFDCVILGAGTGSLVTAIEAFDRGLKPVVLEKMSWAAGIPFSRPAVSPPGAPTSRRLRGSTKRKKRSALT